MLFCFPYWCLMTIRMFCDFIRMIVTEIAPTKNSIETPPISPKHHQRFITLLWVSLYLFKENWPWKLSKTWTHQCVSRQNLQQWDQVMSISQVFVQVIYMLPHLRTWWEKQNVSKLQISGCYNTTVHCRLLTITNLFKTVVVLKSFIISDNNLSFKKVCHILTPDITTTQPLTLKFLYHAIHSTWCSVSV